MVRASVSPVDLPFRLPSASFSTPPDSCHGRFPEGLHHSGCRRPGTAPMPRSSGSFEGRTLGQILQTQRYLYWGVEIVPHRLFLQTQAPERRSLTRRRKEGAEFTGPRFLKPRP